MISIDAAIKAACVVLGAILNFEVLKLVTFLTLSAVVLDNRGDQSLNFWTPTPLLLQTVWLLLLFWQKSWTSTPVQLAEMASFNHKSTDLFMNLNPGSAYVFRKHRDSKSTPTPTKALISGSDFTYSCSGCWSLLTDGGYACFSAF